MGLKDKIKEVIIEYIEESDINSLKIYIWKNRDILKFLYNEKIVEKENIEISIRKAIIDQEKKEYRNLTEKERGLKDKIKNIVIKEIEESRFNLVFTYDALKNKSILNFLYEQKIISDEELVMKK